jgi:Predicted hydrolases or acyltransferases (alpha/beta hydrolase superfamily)
MKDIYYEVIGEGFPIVLLHGNDENHHVFDELVSHLKKDYQCICIDTRYHGLSEKKGTMSYTQFCKDVQDVITELNIDEYDVIGFSDGGITSLLLSSDQRLKHMIVIGANVRVSGLKFIFRLYNWLMLFCLLPFSIYNKKMRIKWCLISMMEFMEEISKETLNQISIPTLIIAGENDLIKQEETEYIHHNIKYSAMKIIKNGTHFVLKENFNETYQNIKMFLDICHKEED